MRIGLESFARRVCKGTEGGHRGANAESDEGKVALGKDCGGNLQSGGNDNYGDAVGKDVLADDSARFCADDLRRKYVVVLFD